MDMDGRPLLFRHRRGQDRIRLSDRTAVYDKSIRLSPSTYISDIPSRMTLKETLHKMHDGLLESGDHKEQSKRQSSEERDMEAQAKLDRLESRLLFPLASTSWLLPTLYVAGG